MILLPGRFNRGRAKNSDPRGLGIRASCRCHGACQAAESQQPDKMKQYSLKTAPTATSKEQKSQNRPKAKRMVIGVDVHLKSYHAACKIDNGAIGAVTKFRSQTELLLYIEKQRQAAEEVVAVYEAGPLGYVLYRELEAHGIKCYVCAPRAVLSAASGARTIKSTLEP